MEREREEYARTLYPSNTWDSFVDALDDRENTGLDDTAGLINSVLRDLEFTDVDHLPACTNHISRQPASATQIDDLIRTQQLCLQNQQMLNKKVDQILALLTPSIHKAGLPSPTVAVQAPTQSLDSTLSSASASVTVSSQQSELSSELGGMTTEHLFDLKRSAKSRPNFAVLLLKELFNPNELEGKNIAGVRGKERVDPERLLVLKNILQRFHPVTSGEHEASWRLCRKAMDEHLR